MVDPLTLASFGLQGAGAISGLLGGLFGGSGEDEARAAAIRADNIKRQQDQELIRGGTVSGLGDIFGKFEDGAFRDTLTPETLALLQTQRGAATETARGQQTAAQQFGPLLQMFMDRIPTREGVLGDVVAAENAEKNSIINPAINDIITQLTRTNAGSSNAPGRLAEELTNKIRGTQVSQRPERLANLLGAQGQNNAQNLLNPALALLNAGQGSFNPSAAGPSGLQTAVAQGQQGPLVLPPKTDVTGQLFGAAGSALGNLGGQLSGIQQNNQLLDAIKSSSTANFGNRQIGNQISPNINIT